MHTRQYRMYCCCLDYHLVNDISSDMFRKTLSFLKPKNINYIFYISEHRISLASTGVNGRQ